MKDKKKQGTSNETCHRTHSLRCCIAFDFGGPMVCDPHHYGEGHINDTFVVWRANHTKRFILQRINTDTFTDPAGLMENICGVTRHLRTKIQAEGGDLAGNA